MRLGELRPVGEIVRYTGRVDGFQWPDEYRAFYMDSGTSALGVALRAAALISGVPEPRVLMPGYACPDLVTAAVWAGTRLVIVDTQPGTPWLDPAALRSTLSDSDVAVIVPHFLGIPHPMEAISPQVNAHGAQLIEDSAQLGPCSPAFQPFAPQVVLSFGRGKPVPAGGGALLVDRSLQPAVRGLVKEFDDKNMAELPWRARLLAQNLAMSRPGYAVARRLPGLDVGATRYKPPGMPRRLSPDAAARVESVLARWPAGVNPNVHALIGALEGTTFEPIAGALGWDGRSPLLRLPVFAGNSEQRDRAVLALQRAGLGASAFYRDVLPDLPGLPPVARDSFLPNARRFAERLFTLPCHADLRGGDVARIVEILARQ